MHFKLVCVPGYLCKLAHQNIETQSYRYAKGSRKNIISGIRTWIYFCKYFGFEHLPASPDNIISFLELCSNTSGYAHIKHLLHSIRFYHQAKNTQLPSTFDLESTVQGLKRKLSGAPNQALPINPEILRKMFLKLDMRKTRDLSVWCSFLTTFFCLFRKSNSVPKSGDIKDDEKVLTRAHFRFNEVSRVVLVMVDFSKVNQFGNRDLVVPIPSNEDPALDLYRHLRELFARVDAPPSAPAFSFAKDKFVTYSMFTTMLKKLLSNSGYNPDKYSGHSFRRGGATFLNSIGGSILQIQACGDWSTLCFTRYLHLTLRDRWSSQKLMSDFISRSCGEQRQTETEAN
jgi:hypothetical protein